MLKETKEKFVKEIHNHSIYEQQRTRSTNGEKYSLWVTKLDGKLITAKEYDGIIERLYDFYRGDYRLCELFPLWISCKAEENITGKTVMEYSRLWKKYYSGSPISEKDIRKITAREWREFFRKAIVENKLTKRRFGELKSVANGIMMYCLESNIVASNPLGDINYKNLPYAPEAAYNNVKAKALTEAQTDSLVTWCREQLNNPKIRKLYYLAIMFNINLGLRFGELSGLRWVDVDLKSNLLTVSGQAVRDIEVDNSNGLKFKDNGRQRVEHLKAYEHARVIPLTEFEIEILMMIESMELSEEYVFPKGQFRYHTYSGKIKAGVEAIGLNPAEFKTHCLRSTAATNLYRECHDVKQVQHMLGHTNPQMTYKYIRDSEELEALRNSRNNLTEGLLNLA